MSRHDLIAILRHYAALPGQACPASVLLEAGQALQAKEAPRRRGKSASAREERLLVLATKHCPREHHDWQEILTLANDATC